MRDAIVLEIFDSHSLFLPIYAFRVNCTIIAKSASHRLPVIRKRFRIKVPRVNCLRARHLIPFGIATTVVTTVLRLPKCAQIRVSSFRAFLSRLGPRARVKQVKVAGLESMLGTGEEEEGDEGSNGNRQSCFPTPKRVALSAWFDPSGEKRWTVLNPVRRIEMHSTGINRRTGLTKPISYIYFKRKWKDIRGMRN